jgi:hypothetical protein
LVKELDVLALIAVDCCFDVLSPRGEGRKSATAAKKAGAAEVRIKAINIAGRLGFG